MIYCTLSHKNGVSHICFTPLNNFSIFPGIIVPVGRVHLPLVFKEVAVLNKIQCPQKFTKIMCMQPFMHKSVCRQSVSLLMLFCSKPSSLQKAAYFYCQKFQPDPSLKTQSSQTQHWAGFFQPYLKEIRGTCISAFELSFRTLALSLLNHWWSGRERKLRRWATYCKQLGHLGLQI